MAQVYGQVARLETSVLVVGAGVVGLTMAILLANQGYPPYRLTGLTGRVDVMVCEAQDEHKTSRPIPLLLLSRTMEIFQSIGMAEELQEASERCYDRNGKMLAMETLTSTTPQGVLLPGFDQETAELTPAPRIFLTQHMLLRVLQGKVKSMRQITLRYNCGIKSLAQHERKVIAQTTFGKIVADYCVGCDGPSGPTQKYVTGGKKSGHGLLTKSMTIAFKTELNVASDPDLLQSMVYINNVSLRGIVRMDQNGQSGMLAVYSTTRRITPDMLEKRGGRSHLARQIVYDAIGRADPNVELITGEDWTAKSETAECTEPARRLLTADIHNGRIFLAGDAARQMAPTGCFGANTGIQDAHNLAWKLVLVLRGEAAPSLVATYQSERHPVGVFVTDQALIRWKLYGIPSQQGPEEQESALPTISIEFGQRYHASAAIAYLGSNRGLVYEDPLWPSSSPGSRAAHLWLRRDHVSRSLFELFDPRRFVLLCSGRGTAWFEVYETQFKGVPLKLMMVPLGEFFSKYKIRDTGAVLVRPDGIIAWKAMDDSEVDKLWNVVRQCLGYNVVEEARPKLGASRTATVPARIPEDLGVSELGEIQGKKAKGHQSLLKRMTMNLRRS